MSHLSRSEWERRNVTPVGDGIGVHTLNAPLPPDNDDSDYVCVDDYPEHDWECVDERDGIRTLSCKRCGAESWEEDFGA